MDTAKLGKASLGYLLYKRTLLNRRLVSWGVTERDCRWTSKWMFTKRLEIRFGESIKNLFTDETESVHWWAFLVSYGVPAIS